jgi:hypothetical protein
MDDSDVIDLSSTPLTTIGFSIMQTLHWLRTDLRYNGNSPTPNVFDGLRSHICAIVFPLPFHDVREKYMQSDAISFNESMQRNVYREALH